MEPETYERSIRRMLATGSDPFRNGTDCCCTVHTNAGRYKQALNEARAIIDRWYPGADIAEALGEMEECCRSILAAGYRMAETTAKIYVLAVAL